MFCPNCGAQNPEGTVFCAACGTKVAAEQPAAQPAFQQPAAQPVYQQPAFQQPVYQQPAYQQPTYQQPVPPASPDAPLPGKVFGIIGMVLGILSVVFFWVWWLGMLFGLPGIILSGIANGKAKAVGRKNGMATAGFVCSLIALILCTVIGVIALIGLLALGGLASIL